jgi:hypothetical protein
VTDADGQVVGRVADLRLRQDGPLLMETQHAFRVTGLIVVPRGSGELLGYERGPGGRAPWLINELIRRRHRDSRFVRWEDVESPDLRLSVTAGTLAPLTDLYERDPGRT